MFIALSGGSYHGLDFLAKALEAKVALIITNQDLDKAQRKVLEQSANSPRILLIKEFKSVQARFADWFYASPSKQLKVIGITGTNGKTSSAFFTAQLLHAQQQRVALIGTLGNGELGKLEKTVNTTPDVIKVHRLLHQFRQEGIEWVVMEVSSHALCLGRVEKVEFNSVALTQVTSDHLDFHGTEEDYQAAKQRLFFEYPAQHRILNAQDKVGQEIVNKVMTQNEALQSSLYAYQANATADTNLKEHGFYSQLTQLAVTQALLSPHGIEGELSIQQNRLNYKLNFKLNLLGGFNLENVCCALAICLVNGFDIKQLIASLPNLNPVAGRMELIHQTPTVIIDFAHTADALEQVLQAIKAHLQDSQGELWVVFGCGGNRDQGKRPKMGKVAELLADKVVITSDNPRDESPEDIIADILQGLQNPKLHQVIVDRSMAIKTSLQQAATDDIILIAGKGHEDYQEIKGVKKPYSDPDVVKRFYQGAI